MLRLRYLVVSLALGCAANPGSTNNQLTADTCRFPPNPADSTVYDSTQVAGRAYALSGPELHYPDQARQEGIQGRVLLSLIIDPEGRAEPQSITIVRWLHPEIDAEAVRYASRAQFRPICFGGRPVRARVTLPIDFKIRRSR